MAKRYGRNQRRRHLERIKALEALVAPVLEPGNYPVLDCVYHASDENIVRHSDGTECRTIELENVILADQAIMDHIQGFEPIWFNFRLWMAESCQYHQQGPHLRIDIKMVEVRP